MLVRCPNLENFRHPVARKRNSGRVIKVNLRSVLSPYRCIIGNVDKPSLAVLDAID